MVGQKGLLSSGLTPYHHIKLLIPLFAAFTPMLYERYLPSTFFQGHHVIKALMYGVLTTGITYLLMGIIKEKTYRLQKAVLMGLLVSELAIFHADDQFPSIVMIIFYMFMYTLALGVDGVHDAY
jgi:hypothetical protein